MSSCSCWATGFSLRPAHAMATMNNTRSSHSTVRRLRFGREALDGRSSASSGGAATALTLGGELTGFPHCRQNCEPSGRFAPHLLHPKMTLVGGVLLVAITQWLSGSYTDFVVRSADWQRVWCHPASSFQSGSASRY